MSHFPQNHTVHFYFKGRGKVILINKHACLFFIFMRKTKTKFVFLPHSFENYWHPLEAVHRIYFILKRIRILDPLWKKWIRIQAMNISLRITDVLNTSHIFYSLFSFYAKTWWTIKKNYNIFILSFFVSWDLWAKSFISRS